MAVIKEVLASYYQQYVELLDKSLHEKNRFTDILALIEQKANVKRVYIAQGLIGALCLYMIFGHFAELICNGVGFIYPAYASFRAIESTKKEDDTQWLTYWVVFAAFSVAEFFSDIIFGWFPLYWLAKIVFLVWCFVPIQNNGSMVVYSRILKPFFLKHTNQVEKVDSKTLNMNKMDEKTD